MPEERISVRKALAALGTLYYGFPLDEEGSYECGQVVAPIDSTLTGREREVALLRQTNAVNRHIRRLVMPLFPNLMIVVGIDRDGLEHVVLALTASTRGPINKLIPPPEKLQQVKEILAAEGFRQESKWFSER
ncbi:hypothetical protein D9615_009947 [Tricholomella constricta]|uniref:Uncharacterized protein n=1 Tax=Tricholomella constricta TaxID=117010 RepID=A0A8H5LTN6_9AGAR|nr:hypothetical protein D9615_009947 [Tricholomella constricta]